VLLGVFNSQAGKAVAILFLVVTVPMQLNFLSLEAFPSERFLFLGLIASVMSVLVYRGSTREF
jgi:hypothetical protein